MRNEMEALLKEELRVLAIKTRDRLHLTQKEMGERLEMSESSYSNIETGVSMCGTLTTVLILLEQKNPEGYLRKLEANFKKQYEEEMELL
ncbi:MAG: helix-turn-helix domain-containing protein [Clostridia bacterium]|nr:helix-turn-helix domain-containing protein [Clostridia bacterium]